jgi:predicted  nucleic acid-binding Zn-ribbon protein
MALLFKRKTSVEKLETELAALHARAKTLGSRHAAAEAAFVDAKAKLQRHLLEADLDADEKVGVKLESAVANCAQRRDNFADALGEARKMISAVEANLAVERTAIERAAAADVHERGRRAHRCLVGDQLSLRDRRDGSLPRQHDGSA